jgi:tetratricopeptide (TPR) repeat protein
MNGNKVLAKKNVYPATAEQSKAFHECISELFDEIHSAIRWDRPSILLAIHPSVGGRRKAQKALSEKLDGLRQVIAVQANPLSDLFRTISLGGGTDRYVYFVEGLGEEKENYRALNLHRETLVDRRIAIVFWLTEPEAVELPRFAPDFWAFRHRVIQFSPDRGSNKRIVPAGLFHWHPEFLHPEASFIDEQISYQQGVLQALPTENEALLLRVDTMESLANLYWYAGESERAIDLLRQGWGLVNPLDVVEARVKLLNGFAVVFCGQGEYNDARLKLEEAIKLDDKNEDLWVNLGIVQYLSGRTSQAIKVIERVIGINPFSVRPQYILGYICLLGGKVERAISCFEQAIKLDKDHFSARCGLAVCFTKENFPGASKRISELFESQEWRTGIYHSICVAALLEDKSSSTKRLQLALTQHKISLQFVRYDPNLFLLFDEAMLSSVQG